MSYNLTKNPWMEHAKRVIFADHGVNVSLQAKNKNLLKFGRSHQVQTTKSTLMELPTGTYNETYIGTNSITQIVSTDAGDTEEIKIEGHTIAGGDFTFVVQTINLTGQTAATLATPLARVTRAYNNDSTEIAGTVSICESDTYTAGVPNTPAGVHLQIRAGEQQSFKCATTLSSVDFWVVTSFYADMLEKTATSAEVTLEIREAGKVFLPKATVSVSQSHRAVFDFLPYLIVPPNADIRLVSLASAAGKDISGGIEGVLLK